MWFFPLSDLWRGRSPKSTSSRRPKSRRLTVETLEDRTVPSTLAAGALAAPNLQPTSALVSSPTSTQPQSFHVDATFQRLYTQGTDLGATVDGTLTLGSGTTLHFTTTVDVKHSGNTIQGTPTLVFDNGSTLTFTYAIKLDRATGVFAGDWNITSGTGMFTGASGVGTISYPISATGTGPLTMDGTIIL
jgi:hypothetical protein